MTAVHPAAPAAPEDTPTIGRRPFLVGAAAVGAGLLAGACGLFDEKDRDRIEYGDADSQFGDLYTPSGAGPWPVMVVIHGGAWRADEDLSIMADASKAIRDRGFAVWSIEYRRVGETGGGFPGTLEDVAAAIDHLETMAEDHSLDLEQVTVLGHSAGGTLALWAGGRDRITGGEPGSDPKVLPTSVLSLAGIPDLATCARQNQLEGACQQFLGGEPGDRPDRYAAVSPLELLPLGRPQVVVQGREDTIVPLGQSQRYAAAAEKAGDQIRLTLVDKANHFSLIDVTDPAWSTVIDEINRLRA